MVKKIITGTRSGTERAALSVAAKLGIAAESLEGVSFDTADSGSTRISYLDSRHFELQKKRLDAGIAASSGTLIFSRGAMTRIADYARRRTLNSGHQLLGIDLIQMNGFQASNLIASWMKLRLRLLNRP